MKIKFILMMLLTSNAFAHAGDAEGVIHFFTDENKSAHEFRIHYPNLTNDRVERGRRISNGLQRDCIAFTFDYSKDDGKEVIEIAKAIKAEQLGKELTLSNVNGTFVYFIQPNMFYATDFKISTLDGNTFTENFRRVLGAETVMNLSLEYRRGCLGSEVKPPLVKTINVSVNSETLMTGLSPYMEIFVPELRDDLQGSHQGGRFSTVYCRSLQNFQRKLRYGNRTL